MRQPTRTRFLGGWPIQAPGLSGSERNGADGDQEPAQRKRRVNPIKRKQMQERLAKVEAEVSRTEATIAECEESLGRFVCVEETQRVTALLEEKRTALASLEGEWAELSEELEATE
jgi:ATP-binding cassette subfamily F protein 3